MKNRLSFKKYLATEDKKIFFTFARMNPPGRGHEVLFEKLNEYSGKNDFKVFLSHSNDKNKNPLIYENKIKYVRKFFPKYGRNVVQNENIRNILEASVYLYNKDYKSLNCVVGEDRLLEFDILLNKYNGKKSNHGFYFFEDINVLSAGERDPDDNGIKGASASKQRQSVMEEDFTSFSQNLPLEVSNRDAKNLFNELREGMNLERVTDFKMKLHLDENEDREKYVLGDTFEINDQIVIKESEEIVTIKKLGPNYVIVEDSLGLKKRKWLNAVEKLT